MNPKPRSSFQPSGISDQPKESDLLGALIWKHLSTLTAQDVKAYREQVLGKD
nr:hypothetical protein [Pseudomonas aeruginosa]